VKGDLLLAQRNPATLAKEVASVAPPPQSLSASMRYYSATVDTTFAVAGKSIGLVANA
jgi:hypothetical protein